MMLGKGWGGEGQVGALDQSIKKKGAHWPMLGQRVPTPHPDARLRPKRPEAGKGGGRKGRGKEGLDEEAEKDGGSISHRWRGDRGLPWTSPGTIEGDTLRGPSGTTSFELHPYLKFGKARNK